MRENLDQWEYVIAAYVVTFVAVGVLLGWSLLSMKRAERQRDEARRK